MSLFSRNLLLLIIYVQINLDFVHILFLKKINLRFVHLSPLKKWHKSI